MRIAILSALLLLPASATRGQDDCYSKPVNDRPACEQRALASLKRQLPEHVAHLRRRLSPDSAAELSNDQQHWLAWLDRICPADVDDATACLLQPYQQRDAQITDGTKQIGGTLIFTRAQFVIAPGKRTSDSPVSDPGFGVGTFEWPEIDHPTDRQAAWNEAVHNAALGLAAGRDQPHPKTFDSAVDPSGTIDLDYSVGALNDHLVEVDFTVMTYGYGAAHPLTDLSSFVWWLDRNRALEPTDIFDADSDWQDKLPTAIEAKLKQDADLVPMLWKDDELRRGISDGLRDISEWQISRSGLTVQFNQYGVAAYAAGGPSVHFTWDELKPFLSSDLKPDQLPVAIEKPAEQ